MESSTGQGRIRLQVWLQRIFEILNTAAIPSLSQAQIAAYAYARMGGAGSTIANATYGGATYHDEYHFTQLPGEDNEALARRIEGHVISTIDRGEFDSLGPVGS